MAAKKRQMKPLFDDRGVITKEGVKLHDEMVDLLEDPLTKWMHHHNPMEVRQLLSDIGSYVWLQGLLSNFTTLSSGETDTSPKKLVKKGPRKRLR